MGLGRTLVVLRVVPKEAHRGAMLAVACCFNYAQGTRCRFSHRV